jgi:ligand-binding sensor domain-containing protein
MGHAINALATERGLLYIEPQTGQVLNLTPAESNSRFRCIF